MIYIKNPFLIVIKITIHKIFTSRNIHCIAFIVNIRIEPFLEYYCILLKIVQLFHRLKKPYIAEHFTLQKMS